MRNLRGALGKLSLENALNPHTHTLLSSRTKRGKKREPVADEQRILDIIDGLEENFTEQETYRIYIEF